MKTSLTLCAVVVLLLTNASSHAANLNKSSVLDDTQTVQDINPTTPQFSNSINDLPIMPGLTLQPDEDVLFVTPSTGRIATSVATGIVDVDDVYRFYAKTLPQMGWKTSDKRSYFRDADQLTIKAHADGKLTRVEFTVTPKQN